MIPEFLGRLPIVFTLQGMSEDMLVEILKEPKNAIFEAISETACIRRSKLNSMTAHFMRSQKKAMKKDTGARALSCDHRRIHVRYHV